jgi:hypothetical protein
MDFALAVREPPELGANFVRKQSLFLLFGCFAKVDRLAACHQPNPCRQSMEIFFDGFEPALSP